MLKKLIAVPLVAILLSIGSVAVAPATIEVKACGMKLHPDIVDYPGYVMSVARPNYDPYVKEFQMIFAIAMRSYTNDSVYNISFDGYFGFMTQAAVLRYQDTHGLQRDGQVGPATWASIKSHYVPYHVEY